MTSPARQHFERVRAQRQAAAVAAGESLAGATGYELMLAKLQSDRVRLADVQSAERKAEVKRELLPDYADYVAGVLDGGRGAQDDVLATVLVWRIDAGDYAGALDIARYALAHGLKLPDQFQRELPVALAEEFADVALKAMQAGGTFSASILADVGGMTNAHDMPDQVRAKLLKAYGMAANVDPLTAENRELYVAALTALRRAAELNPLVGVKQEIGRREKALAKFDAEQKQKSDQLARELQEASGGNATGT